MSAFTMDLIAQLAALLGSLAGFIYGLLKMCTGKRPMYMNIIVMGVGCAVISRIFNISCLLNEGALRTRFNVGSLGSIGVFLALLSANFGQFDGIVDDGQKEHMKYRLYPLIGSLVPFAAIPLVYLSPLPPSGTVCHVISLLLIGMGVYYHIKHLIFPDVEFGIANSIRPYNFLAILYALFMIGDILAFAYERHVFLMINGFISGFIILLLVIELKKGVDRWII